MDPGTEVTVTMLGGAVVKATVHEDRGGETVTVKVENRYFSVARSAVAQEPDDPDFDYDNVIKIAKEMWGDPYGPDGEYKPEMISAAIAEIQRRKEVKA